MPVMPLCKPCKCIWVRIAVQEEVTCITTSHGIAVKWYLRVYWLLPFSIVASFKKNRRFFCRAPSILLLRIDDSFGKHRRFFFIAPWILGPFNQFHFPKESFPYFNRLFFSSSTEIADSLAEVILNQQTPSTRPSSPFVDKTVMPKIPDPSVLLDHARICACAIGWRTSMKRSLSLV